MTKNKRVLPAFKTEAEEAEWWYKNRARLDKDLLQARRKGELKRLDRATLKRRLAAARSRVISIRLPEDDIELARQQASRRGLPYQTYIKSVLHQALRQADEARLPSKSVIRP
jgi:predicted DNA binding CopG/RHH family protein